MSAVFFKVSWPQTIEKYRSLRVQARKGGKKLVVKNMSRTRGIPIFLFFLADKVSDRSTSFSDLDEVAAALDVRS